MAMDITKLKKENNDTIIMDCDTGEDMDTLKATIQVKLGENFKIMEPVKIKD